MKYIVSLSGGKDSTACLLWALDNIDKDKVVPVYIDTKWEHHSVYDYLDYLEDKLDIQIERIESEGMEALCERKRCLPNQMIRFCTENLKIIPYRNWLFKNFISKDIDFITIVGVRRAESKKRANAEMIRLDEELFCEKKEKVILKTLYPIVYWSTQRVFDYLKQHDIEPNPLYKKGWSRVGCYPCIFAKNSELKLMEQGYKDRLRELESKISSIVGKKVTFFQDSKDKHIRQQSLGLDLGCVNQYGICE